MQQKHLIDYEKHLFVTCAKEWYMLMKDEAKVIPDLESTHEEADTRMILHAAHALEQTVLLW